MNEKELINSILNGNKDNFRIIIDTHSKHAINTAYSIIKNKEIAEEICHNAFINLYKNLENFKGKSTLATYLTRIIINLSINETKKKKTFQIIDNLVIEKSENDDEKEDILYVLSKLKKDYQTIITTRILNDYSIKETAEILKLPIGTVTSRLKRAIEEFKIIYLKIKQNEKEKSYN